jgi:heme oxygenase
MRAAPILVFVALTLVPGGAWPQGNPLGPEFRVNTYTTDDQAQPSVAADSAGNFVVVWQSGPYPNNIFGQRYASSGAPLGAEFRVNAVPNGLNNTLPAAAADPAGNFVVIWNQSPLTGTDLRGQRFASSGAPLGGEFDVGGSGYPFDAAVASDSAGNFVVVWHDLFPIPTAANVFGQRYASSGSPLGAPFQVNTYTTGLQSATSVAVNPSGSFVVVWNSDTQDGSGLGVFGQRFDSSGAPLGSEFRVNTYTTSSQQLPSVAADPSGNFVVVWQSESQDGSSAGIFGQRYASSGAPLGPEFLVNTFTTSYQRRPSVGADAAGNFVVVWESALQDGSSTGIAGQRFSGSGEPLGSEFLVNTYTTNGQAQPSVAADAFGDFVVVWESDLQDGSGAGVYGQRYRPILPVELMNLQVE